MLRITAAAVAIVIGATVVHAQNVEVVKKRRDVMQAIAKLEQHLKDDPSDLQGWLLLGQTYTRMARFDDALEAYRHAVGVSQGTNPAILSSFAEAQIAAAQGMVSEEARSATHE